FDWRALALLIAIAAPWYIAILAKEGRGLIDGFILKHNVGRFTGPVSGHAGSLLYYFPVVLLLTLPFTALLVPVAQRIRDVWRDDLQLYLLLWFVFVFVFFSISGTKLPHYLLYGYTGLVLLAAVASLSTLVVPTIGFAQQGSIKEAAILCREQHLDAVLWRLNAPSFSVYRGAPTPSRDPRPGDVIVTKANRLTELPPALSYDLLYSKHGIVLARIRA